MYDEYTIYNAAMAITGCRDDQLDRDYLEHHGILGMKWGIRRYQNEDGSLTPEGERRYRETGYGERSSRTLTDRNAVTGFMATNIFGSIGASGATAIATKKMWDMSDDEAEEAEKDIKAYSRLGRNISGGILGAALGGSTTAVAGTIAVAALTGNPALTQAAYIGGMAVGGVLGGIGGAKLGGKSFDRSYEKGMERNRYIKRSKKEIAEYDRQHAIDNFQNEYSNAGGSLIDNNANYDVDEYGRVKSAKVRL